MLPTLSTIEFKEQVLRFAQADGAPSVVGEQAKTGKPPADFVTERDWWVE